MVIQTHRGVVVAKNGMVASSQPLATAVGLSVLQEGGSFVDAAIATSAVLAVVEPFASHIGGDAFVIAYDASTRKTTAFNGSGAAPARASLAAFGAGIPLRGLKAATVPGLVDCWLRLHERWGSRPIAELLRPAHAYAEKGFPAGYRYSAVFQQQAALSEPWFDSVSRKLAGSRTPERGELVIQKDLAWTLEQIAVGGRDAFYDGPVAARMVDYSERHGGLFSRDDFAAHSTQVSDPIRTDYRGFTVHGQPPVSQGHILLQELNLLEGFDLHSAGWGTADGVHLMVEAKKLAFADRYAYLGDPTTVTVPLERLLSKQYAAERRALIHPGQAQTSPTAGSEDHDTTYFCIVDGAGNAVSFIQSVFHRFGCGEVVDGTGVLFNNRLTGFSLDPVSPNVLAPRKRPAHTLNAYLLTRGDQLAWVGGTPGGDVQVQSNMQAICNVVDFGMNPQEAIEAPRWQHGPQVPEPGAAPADVLQMEERFSTETMADLQARGHRVRAIGPWAHGSSYQLIAVDATTGSYQAGSDPRCDGHAAGF